MAKCKIEVKAIVQPAGGKQEVRESILAQEHWEWKGNPGPGESYEKGTLADRGDYVRYQARTELGTMTITYTCKADECKAECQGEVEIINKIKEGTDKGKMRVSLKCKCLK